ARVDVCSLGASQVSSGTVADTEAPNDPAILGTNVKAVLRSDCVPLPMAIRHFDDRQSSCIPKEVHRNGQAEIWTTDAPQAEYSVRHSLWRCQQRQVRSPHQGYGAAADTATEYVSAVDVPTVYAAIREAPTVLVRGASPCSLGPAPLGAGPSFGRVLG